MLWVGLHLPLLSLESFAATLPPEQAVLPMALVQAHRIASACVSAQAVGVVQGIKRATALALAPNLLLGQADDVRDAQALSSVAHAALAFTPAVTLLPPSQVLMEVRSSLRYFKGLPALLDRLARELAPLGHALQIVSAPTAQGAALLSRCHHGLNCADHAALQRALNALSLGWLDTAADQADAMQGMGLHTLGQLCRQPRDGLARRFGKALLEEIDRAFGNRPDPREPLVPPPVFDSRLELFARADTTEQLLHGAQVLLQRLIAWLSAQHAFVRRFTLRMHHEARWRDGRTPPVTELEIAVAQPSRDAKHLLVLLRERLAILQLQAPTLELSMQAHDIAHQPPPNGEMFPTPRSERDGIARLIERLQARLGREQVQRLQPLADYRPEKSTAIHPADPLMRAKLSVFERTSTSTPSPAPITRPVWLLPQAQRLQEAGSRPLLNGQALHFLSGPERIETGWWDGGLVERDYFIAQARDGTLLWLYRESLPRPPASREGWFLHGRFG